MMMNREEIKKQAEKLMESFGKALEKSGVKEKTVFVEREKDRREEKEEKCDSEFRKIVFSNAPEVKDDFIIAEKGEWEEWNTMD